jgi:PAS domain S-box-containing protein
MTILIVDDNEENLYQLQVLLGGSGYQVVTAAHGAEALAKARQNPPDLIIADILMPVMDGFTLCREWKKDEGLRPIPFVFYTATYTDERDREFALSLGAEQFLVKPEEPEVFIRTIREVIQQVSRPPAPPARAPIEVPRQEEAGYLKQYNEVLIRKLEAKMQQLEQANHELEQDIAERKRTQETLREREEIHSAIVRQAVDAIVLVEANSGRFVEFNRAAHESLGYRREEFAQLAIPDIDAGIGPEKIHEHMAATFARGEAVFETRQRRRDGELRDVRVSVRSLNIRGKDYFAAIWSDITERKHMEKSLRASEERFKIIATNTPDHILLQDADLRYVWVVNPQLGLTEGDMIGKTDFDILGREDAEKLTKIKREVLASGEPTHVEVPLVSLDGDTEYFDGSYVPQHGPDGKADGLIGYFRKVTERRQAEETLRNREGVLQKIFDILPVGLWFSDKNGKLLRGNPTGVKIWGAEPKVSPSEYGVFKARRLPSGEEVAPDDWALAHTIRDGVTIVDELLEIDAFDGKKKTILNYTAPVLDDQGNIQGAIVVNQDITERRQAEQQLLEYQGRLKELAAELTLAEERERRRIAVGVHDRIGQRLAMTKLTLQSLPTSTLETNTARAIEEVCKDVDKVLEDAHSLTFELSNPILYEVGFEPAVESWLFQQVRDRQGIECTFEADESAARLDKETRVVLFDVVREILTNVVKHAKAKHVNVRIRRIKGTMQTIVQDDGIGFQPPQAGSRSSTPVSESGGFGLFNIREKLDYLGGSLTIESAPGQGTCVVAVVPLKSPRNTGKDRENKECGHENLDRR